MSPARMKTRKHLRRERAEDMWKDLVRKGWKRYMLSGVPQLLLQIVRKKRVIEGVHRKPSNEIVIPLEEIEDSNN